MTKISEQQLDDLAKLATDRVSKAVRSVDQLIEDPEQASLLQLMVIGSLVIDAADHMAKHVTLNDGSSPDVNVCFFKVLATIARSGDVDAIRNFMAMEEE